MLAVTPRGATASEPAAAARPTVSRPAPNPASRRSALTVSVPAPERAVVVDALGREVLVLLDGDVTGTATLDVPTSRLAPGVYTVRVAGATFAETRRLTVVRQRRGALPPPVVGAPGGGPRAAGPALGRPRPFVPDRLNRPE